MASVSVSKIKTGIEALQTEGVFVVEFMVDGFAIKVIGHPYNEFIAGAFVVDSHMPYSSKHVIEHGSKEERSVIAQILEVLRKKK